MPVPVCRTQLFQGKIALVAMVSGGGEFEVFEEHGTSKHAICEARVLQDVWSFFALRGKRW